MMQKTRVSKAKTLSEKITALVSQSNNGSSDDESDASAPRVVDFEDEYEVPAPTSTEIRKRNVKLLSEQSSRYHGKIASRKDFDTDENDLDSDSGSEDIEQQDTFIDTEDGSETNLTDDMDDSESEASDEEREETSQVDDLENEENIIDSKNSRKEIEQGLCVQNQLRIWEKLLELRIQMQKILTKSNSLPNFQCIEREDENKTDPSHILKETADNVNTLITKLLDLKSNLKMQFSEIRNLKRSSLKRQLSLNDEESDGPPIKRIADSLETDFNEFRTYRNSVLLKWDDRTKLMKSNSKLKSAQDEFDIIKKIENALRNRNSLIKQSQTLKSASEEVQKGEEPFKNNNHKSQNNNIYDDSDFYHHQLRELIEYKANTSANMFEVTKQYSELQKLRQKMKKKVDTRASKGRKLRYVVHNKLVNFMAPEDTSTWTEESRNELCKSLFAS